MIKKKILILTDDMPWGHRSIARAIYGGLKKKEKENNWQVEYAEVKAEIGVGRELYTFISRYSPKLNRLVTVVSGENAFRLMDMVAKDNLVRLKKVVKKVKPDLIICTFYYHSHSLAKWKKDENLNFDLWTVVADPWTVLEASFIPGVDMSIVYDEVMEERAMDFGISEDKILKTGWWVRKEMNDSKLKVES